MVEKEEETEKVKEQVSEKAISPSSFVETSESDNENQAKIDLGESMETAEIPQEERDEDHEDRIAALEAELEEEKKLKEEYLSHLQRLAADFENYKRRTAKEIAGSIDKGKEILLVELLKVLDNFENAIHVMNESTTPSIESMRQGFELIHKQLKDILAAHGVVRIEALGTEFDPRFHEAVAFEPVEGTMPNQVIQEYEGGYLFKDRLLRATKVKVSG